MESEKTDNVMLHSFLMIGQSNMAGRGFQKDVALIYDEHIKMLRNGRWQIMWEPINYDRPNAGVGLSSSFAAAWRLENNSEEIGLIPCADGGTSLEDWNINGPLFEHAVFQGKLAQKSSRLDGILLHQGENNCYPESATNNYEEKLSLIIDTLRKELNVQDIPLIVGGLGDYLSQGMYGEYFTHYPKVNQALENYANTYPDCYFVTAAGLTSNPDGIHIDAISQRIFGVRYHEAFSKRKNILKPLGNEKEIIEKINERPMSQSEKKGLIDIKFSIGELSLDDYKKELSLLNS